MLTFFTTAKPFHGHNGIIQRNALQSWKLLHPDAEVILFGDDEGAAETCQWLDLVHHPEVKQHESGTKQLDYMFRRANEIARHNYLCFSNCDIILMGDFWAAFQKVRSWRDRFLLVSQRWDLDVASPIDFSHPGWAENLRNSALTRGVQRDEFWVDFFLFPKPLYLDMPPLIVGHCYWDNWMIWKGLKLKLPVVDASRFVVPVHQNHGYNPKHGRTKGRTLDQLSELNLKLIGGITHARLIGSATHRIALGGELTVSLWHYVDALLPKRKREFLLYRIWLPTWHTLLNITRPVRAVLGLRSRRIRPHHNA